MSIADTYWSWVEFVGRLKQRYMSPTAGGVYACVLLRTRSGWPIAQPPSKFSGVGRSARFPSGAPFSAHFARVSMFSCERTRGLSKTPQLCTGFHGGI